MKNLGEVKTIIGKKITRSIKAEILNINQKRDIRNLFEIERMNSYYATIFSIKFRSFISVDQANNDELVKFAAYQ